MDSKKMKAELEKRLAKENRSFSFDREKDQLRIEDAGTGKGITITLPGIIAKYQEQKEKAIDEVVYYVEEGLEAMNGDVHFSGKEKNIIPVIRSTSFPSESQEGVSFLYDDHTAETRIYYALDLGNTYRLIDEALISKEGWERERIKETALFNVRSLSTALKKDHVAGNTFYFLNKNDGYDASRILNEAFLKEMKQKLEGDMAVAVPHQDVLIIADIKNETGYDVLAQMAMSFFASGRVPITALSFLYENGELEPIFILGKNKKK
ncbi:DUF1444 domain-containing protein [Cytobacillus horneckiae]|uniref:UPF0354 protein CWS20_23755 n=1 Tax=Cytobacillus horneckiae TaxID=549687 RepID=A0A2N0ZAI6_9BACI|nr:DUF1444 domain-containing protein [Cytobacillus horneckiae]MBN6889403.1 DUF1444 domain-containing protein [Cytobacillus horneckiae]MEC1154958.1 DUF1444 domain-containing protein [Cytobacillus horneckiae]MED2936136.1 DUF1444 domain-containing protein [Cytobacillus horneckiae]PKG26520.1 DUF1444 domain-containing protein [Cytobacillus horneckiae]